MHDLPLSTDDANPRRTTCCVSREEAERAENERGREKAVVASPRRTTAGRLARHGFTVARPQYFPPKRQPWLHSMIKGAVADTHGVELLRPPGAPEAMHTCAEQVHDAESSPLPLIPTRLIGHVTTVPPAIYAILRRGLLQCCDLKFIFLRASIDPTGPSIERRARPYRCPQRNAEAKSLCGKPDSKKTNCQRME